MTAPSPDPALAALEAAGFEVAGRICFDPDSQLLDHPGARLGDLIVRFRRPPPQEQESECVSMFREEVMRTHPNLDQYPVIAAFRAALAREVEASYQRGREDEAHDRI